MKRTKCCFVTVGTTSFDELIRKLNEKNVRNALMERFGVEELIIQYGRGKVLPDLSSEGGLRICAFDFKSTLNEDMASADLIISHAGAGSIIESLRLGKPLIVVVNDALMDNHQIELANALQKGGYLSFASSPKEFLEVLEKTDLSSFRPYPARQNTAFAKMIDEEMLF